MKAVAPPSFLYQKEPLLPQHRVPFSPLPCPAMTEVVQDNAQALATALLTTRPSYFNKLTILAETRTSTKTKCCSSQDKERKGIQKYIFD